MAAPGTELTADVLEAELEQGRDRGRLRLVLRNDDGRYNASGAPAALSPGGELAVGPGYETSAGDEASEGPRFWIRSVARRRRDGAATVEVEAVDGWGVLRAWTAPRQLRWDGGVSTAYQVLRETVRRAGLETYGSGTSTEATTLKPAFTVRAGEHGAAAVARLLAALPDWGVMRGQAVTLTEPLASDATDYEFGDGHAVLEMRVQESGRAAGWARVFGAGVFAEAVDGEALRDGAGAVLVMDENLDAQARADVRAATILRQDALAAPRGVLVAPPNVGQEVGDVVEVTDAVLGLSAARYRVESLRIHFARGAGSRPRYEMALSLTEV